MLTAAFTAAQYIPAPDWLFSTTGTLVVESNPQGVPVLVNGTQQGVTPLTLKVERGRHEVELRGPGKPKIFKVFVSRGDRVAQYVEFPRRDEAALAPTTISNIIEGSRWLSSDLSEQFAPRRRRRRDVAAVPYDVVDADEARALAAGNPLSFLHVSRAEIDLPGVGPYDDRVYQRRRRSLRDTQA